MSDHDSTTAAVAWSHLSARQRRVLGTLMEKSKTTPDAYPMTFAALTTGCNQKTNRAPITNLTTEQVEKTVDELRTLGAATLVQGNGRVEKVRHYAYQWFGLSKVEAAVLTELLLRGEQTVGELRTRASRMEPIADLAELQKLLDGLEARNLIAILTPAGRGQVLSHNIYPEWELEQVKKNVASGGVAIGDDEEISTPATARPHSSSSASHSSVSSSPNSSSIASPMTSSPSNASAHATTISRSEFMELRDAVERLSVRLAHLERELGINADPNLS